MHIYLHVARCVTYVCENIYYNERNEPTLALIYSDRRRYMCTFGIFNVTYDKTRDGSTSDNKSKHVCSLCCSRND